MYKEDGYDLISITDHDETGGVEEAIEAGRQFGVKVVPELRSEALSMTGMNFTFWDTILTLMMKICKWNFLICGITEIIETISF